MQTGNSSPANFKVPFEPQEQVELSLITQSLLLTINAVSQPTAASPHHFVKVKVPADALRGFPALALPWSNSEQLKASHQGPKTSSLLHGHGFAACLSGCNPLAFHASLKKL